MKLNILYLLIILFLLSVLIGRSPTQQHELLDMAQSNCKSSVGAVIYLYDDTLVYCTNGDTFSIDADKNIHHDGEKNI